ncbi:MAG: hypothetical protein ABNH02_03105 [Pseudomonadales bacterium]
MRYLILLLGFYLFSPSTACAKPPTPIIASSFGKLSDFMPSYAASSLCAGENWSVYDFVDHPAATSKLLYRIAEARGLAGDTEGSTVYEAQMSEITRELGTLSRVPIGARFAMMVGDNNDALQFRVISDSVADGMLNLELEAISTVGRVRSVANFNQEFADNQSFMLSSSSDLNGLILLMNRYEMITAVEAASLLESLKEGLVTIQEVSDPYGNDTASTVRLIRPSAITAWVNASSVDS